MSGGSWDYLYSAWERGETPSAFTMREAAARLKELGDHESAEKALAVAALLGSAEAQFKKIAGYGGPLQMMEWVDSGDHLEEDYVKAMNDGWENE